MKKTLLLLAAALFFSQASQAAVIISVTSGTSSPVFRTSTGTLVPDGSFVRIGTFAVEPSASSTFADLNASFQDFGFTTTGHTAAAGANKGLINRTGITGDSGGQPDSFFVSKPVYLWVFNDTVANSTADQGVYKATTGVFVDDPLGSATSVSVSSFRSAYGAFNPGTAASVTANAGNTATASFALAGAVPEPSVTALFGLLGLVGLRRKR